MQLLEDRFSKTVDSFKTKIMSVRTGRPSPDLLSSIVVGVWGNGTDPTIGVYFCCRREYPDG